MTKLTDSQTRLLTRASGSDDGVTPADDHPKTIEALVARGFILAIEPGEGERKLQITDAGRAAIATHGDGNGGTDHGDENGSSESPAPDIAEHSPPPARRRQIGTLVALDLGTQHAMPHRASSETPSKASVTSTKEPKGKTAALVALLRRPEGATIEAMIAATGWQAHSVRGCLSGALKKGLGLEIASEKTEAGRVYRIVETAA